MNFSAVKFSLRVLENDAQTRANMWRPSLPPARSTTPPLLASLLAAVITAGTSDDARDDGEALRIRECLRGGGKY